MADATTVRQRLLARAFLYDDPDCYAAGVAATLCELSAARDGEAPPSRHTADEDPLPSRWQATAPEHG